MPIKRVFVVLVTCLALSPAVLAQEPSWENEPFHAETAWTLAWPKTRASFDHYVSKVDSMPEFKRIRLAFDCLRLLANATPTPMSEYEAPANGPNLNTCAGRAEWMILHLVDKSSVDEKRSLDQRIEAWTTDAAKRHVLSAAQRTELIRKYAGKIRIGDVEKSGKDARSWAALFDEFLSEWFAYGKDPQEMCAILGIAPDGKACEVQKDRVIIRFLEDMSPVQFIFHLKDGRVDRVNVVLANA